MLVVASLRSDALVLFGVTGDLAHKMIFPALYRLTKRGALTVPVIGVARQNWSRERLRKRVTDSIERAGGIDNKRALKQLLSRLTYVRGDYTEMSVPICILRPSRVRGEPQLGRCSCSLQDERY